MPSKRAPGQQQVLLMMREAFVEAVDEAFAKAGFSNRADFIRTATYEKLIKLGYAVPKELMTAPQRTKPKSKPREKLKDEEVFFPPGVKKFYTVFPAHKPSSRLNEVPTKKSE